MGCSVGSSIQTRGRWAAIAAALTLLLEDNPTASGDRSDRGLAELGMMPRLPQTSGVKVKVTTYYGVALFQALTTFIHFNPSPR